MLLHKLYINVAIANNVVYSFTVYKEHSGAKIQKFEVRFSRKRAFSKYLVMGSF